MQENILILCFFTAMDKVEVGVLLRTLIATGGCCRPRRFDGAGHGSIRFHRDNHSGGGGGRLHS